MTFLRRLAHFVTRFLQVATARGLRPREQAEAAALLTARERALFWSQSRPDQRHGLSCARHVLRARPGRVPLARAALLHDIGKRHARLGLIGRSLASGLSMFRIPVSGRMRVYLEHGEIGALDLEAAGADRLVVDYARHHHRGRPDTIPPEDWRLLQAADHARPG